MAVYSKIKSQQFDSYFGDYSGKNKSLMDGVWLVAFSDGSGNQ